VLFFFKQPGCRVKVKNINSQKKKFYCSQRYWRLLKPATSDWWPRGALKIAQGLSWRSSGYESAFQCRGHWFHPWSGNLDPYMLSAEELMLLNCGVGEDSWESLGLQGDPTFTFHFHALEKEMATHSSVLAWRIPGMGEPGGLPSMGSHRVGHDWSDLAAAAAVKTMGLTI